MNTESIKKSLLAGKYNNTLTRLCGAVKVTA